MVIKRSQFCRTHPDFAEYCGLVKRSLNNYAMIVNVLLK